MEQVNGLREALEKRPKGDDGIPSKKNQVFSGLCDWHNLTAQVTFVTDYTELSKEEKKAYPRQMTVVSPVTLKEEAKVTKEDIIGMVYERIEGLGLEDKFESGTKNELSVGNMRAMWSKGGDTTMQTRHTPLAANDPDLYETPNVGCPMILLVALDEPGKLRYWPNTHIGRGTKVEEHGQPKDITWAKGDACVYRADLHMAEHIYDSDNMRLMVELVMPAQDEGYFAHGQVTPIGIDTHLIESDAESECTTED